MKVEVRVLKIEAEISIEEDTGDYLLELELTLSDGTTKQLEKILKRPHFTIELAEADHKEDEERKESGN